MSISQLFFVTLWTAIGGFTAFMVVGIVEQADRWWQERHRRG